MSNDEGEKAEVKQPEAEKPEDEKDKKWYQKIIWQGAIGAVFAILVGIAIPSINRWMTPTPPPSPAPILPVIPKTLRAKIEKITVDSGGILKDHLDEVKASNANYTPKELVQVGYLVHFQVQIEGFKDRKCKASWELHDANDGSRIALPDPWLQGQDVTTLEPDESIDSAAATFWVPQINRRSPFVVRVSIYDDKGGHLTSEDSAPIKSRAAKR